MNACGDGDRFIYEIVYTSDVYKPTANPPRYSTPLAAYSSQPAFEAEEMENSRVT